MTLSPNASSEVFVNMTIPHYVPQHLRSKVTVTATARASNSFDVVKEELSFYFIVIGKEASLADIDTSPPRCVLDQDCWQESCQEVSEG